MLSDFNGCWCAFDEKTWHDGMTIPSLLVASQIFEYLLHHLVLCMVTKRDKPLQSRRSCGRFCQGRLHVAYVASATRFLRFPQKSVFKTRNHQNLHCGKFNKHSGNLGKSTPFFWWRYFHPRKDDLGGDLIHGDLERSKERPEFGRMESF